MPYAQTNIQLYNQLCRGGWSEGDLRHVHGAYELAMRVFAGQFGANHKPFLAHLVGVASILADAGADSTIVSAGLLHSAYMFGEFGDGLRGIKERKRRQVRRAVGAACEALIARYGSFSWNLAALTSFSRNRTCLSPADEVVALIKLADTLEDHLDYGMRYAPQKRVGDRSDVQSDWRAAIVELAMSMGQSRLAAELADALDPDSIPVIPDFLRASERASFVVAPVTHSMRTTVRLGRAYRRWRARLAAKSRLQRGAA